MLQTVAFPSVSRSAGSERKLVTVLFADIVASCALVSGRDPEDADLLLRTAIGVFSTAITRFGGLVAQKLGDGVMAVFGAPAACEDHALRACLAAQDMVQAITGGNGTDTVPAVRIGIASGEVVVQHVTDAACQDLRLVGECVHLAAKLQQRAEENSVLLSQETLMLTKGWVTAWSAGNYQLAAGGRIRQVYRLADAKIGRQSVKNLPAFVTGRLIGRRVELAALKRVWSAVQSRQGRSIVIRGDAGIGKSSLVGAFLGGLDHDAAQVILWPQVELRPLDEPGDFEQAAQSLIAAAVTGGKDLDTVGQAIEKAGGPLARSALYNLLGLDQDNHVWRAIEPSQRLSLEIEALVALTIDIAEHRRLIVVVEDAHWARATFRRFLATLAPLLSTRSVLLIVTSRWEGSINNLHGAVDPIDLGPFSGRETDEFLEAALGKDPTASMLKNRLAEKSQGVPLYLDECLRELETRGAVIGRRGAYRLVNPDQPFDLPMSVQGLISSRIDALPAAHRQTLLHAAVIGTSFDLDLLSSLETVDRTALAADVRALESVGFVEQFRILPNREYRFRHGLLREVAYGTLTRADRRELHARLLRAIRLRRRSDLPNRVALLAYHAFCAEEWAIACAYGRAAGRQAENRSRLDQAAQHYEAAMLALVHLPETARNRLRQIDLDIALPRIYLPSGLVETQGYLDKAVELAEINGNPDRLARSVSMLASFAWARAKLDEAIRLYEKGLAALGSGGYHAARTALLVRLCGTLIDKGEFLRAGKVNAGLASLAQRNDGHTYGLVAIAAVGSLSYQAHILAETGAGDAAIASAQAAVALAERHGHLFSISLANTHLGWVHVINGDGVRCLGPLETALSTARDIRSRLWQPLILAALGYAAGLTGDTETALRQFHRSFDCYTANRCHPLINHSQVQLWYAETLARAGQPGEALDVARQTLALTKKTNQLAYQARTLFLLARLAADHGGVDEATAFARESQRIAASLGMAPLTSAIDTLLAGIVSG